jgi:hypothetical protein
VKPLMCLHVEVSQIYLEGQFNFLSSEMLTFASRGLGPGHPIQHQGQLLDPASLAHHPCG